MVTKKRSLEKQLQEKEANAERISQQLDAVKTKREEVLQKAAAAEEKKMLAITVGGRSQIRVGPLYHTKTYK